MDIQTGFFYFFSLVLLFAAIRVVTARNPVHAVLYLILAFSQASGIWLLLKAEFLAIALILVYLGAVMVLFLFVVMMLDINIDSLKRNFWKHVPIALLMGGLIASEMVVVIFGGFDVRQVPEMAAVIPGAVNVGNSKMLGALLYTEYIYPVQIAAVLLLVAMIAAIALTLKDRKVTKKMNPSLQVRVKAKDRLVIVPLAATQMPEVEAVAQETQEAGK
ncbi:MAG: NADH-quinone oxidoreductase subunit J [Ottowia sp.]